MTNKQFIRNISGQVYDTKNDKYYSEDYTGKPLDYDDEVIVLLNEFVEENHDLKKQIQYWKDKYYEEAVTVIYEYSTNIDEDLQTLEKEVEE